MMSISMLFDNPHAAVPIAAKVTAVWFAARLPIALHNRP